jgi:hypothetical protein
LEQRAAPAFPNVLPGLEKQRSFATKFRIGEGYLTVSSKRNNRMQEIANK